ncbi:MAG: DUF1566 domain-containing protein [Magnetococcales bacterium]|nr:DUF1566 domain-containing protein [Magnetococcales bacterium]
MVTFKIGEITLGSAAGATVLTPINLVPNGTSGSIEVVNIARLIQGLDDNKYDNKIKIPAMIHDRFKSSDILAGNLIQNFSFKDASFAANASNLLSATTASYSYQTYLPSQTEAKTAMENYLVSNGLISNDMVTPLGTTTFASALVGSKILPKTGQYYSYGTRDDGTLQLGVAWPKPRFMDHGNGTITDRLTGLIWLKNAGCLPSLTWLDMMAASKTVANGSCGLSDGSTAGDWRIPNRFEMESLFEYSRSGSIQNALPPDHPFTNVKSFYSTSTSTDYDKFNSKGLQLSFEIRTSSIATNIDIKSVPNYGWPVRGGGNDSSSGAVAPVLKTGQTKSYTTGDDGDLQKGFTLPAGTTRFVDNGNGTINDKLTGLVWLKNANCFGGLGWRDALLAANSLAQGGCGLKDNSVVGDWRMPNVIELKSLLDMSRLSPALPANHPFSSVQSGIYWSSTTLSLSAYTQSVFIDFSSGEIDQMMLNVDAKYVWPVRDAK